MRIPTLIRMNGLIIMSLFSTLSMMAQPNLFGKFNYISGGDTLPYRMFTPEAVPDLKFPLVIFLHGSGERGNDNEAQLRWSAHNFITEEMMISHPAFVVAPQCPANAWWSNFEPEPLSGEVRMKPEPTKPMAMVIELIRQLSRRFPIDTSRIYITGLSMGGMGTFDAICRYPEMFAAAVPVCGIGDISKADVIARTPVWMFHGAVDVVVKPENSLKMAEALTRIGARPGCTIYPEVGHFSWIPAYKDNTMIEWLFRQRK